MTQGLVGLFFTAIILAATPVVAVDKSHPDPPDFDPVAMMKRFDANWVPPDTSADEVAKHALGSWENPVRTQGPTGQKSYLARLGCADGTAPGYKRLGSHGNGIYGFQVDAFEVVCGERKSVIYIDLYHPKYIEASPVPGFRIKPAGSN